MSTETVEEKEAVQRPSFTVKINGKLLKETMMYLKQFFTEAHVRITANEPPSVTATGQVPSGELPEVYDPDVLGYFRIFEMDASHVVAVRLTMPVSSFASPGAFNVDIEDVGKSIVGRLLQGDVLMLVDEHSLIVQNNREKAMLPLLEYNLKNLPVLKLRFNGHITISQKALHEAFVAVMKVSDEAYLKLTDEGLTVEARSEMGNYETSFLKGDPEVYEIASYTEPMNGKALYGAQYLKELTAFNMAPIVRLQFTTDKPISISYVVPPVTITCYLAPRME